MRNVVLMAIKISSYFTFLLIAAITPHKIGTLVKSF